MIDTENTTANGLTGDKTKTLEAADDTRPSNLAEPADTSDTLGLRPLSEDDLFSIADDLFGKDASMQVQDIWYKGQRVIRTVMQVLVGFVVAAPTVTQVISAIGLDPASNTGAWLAGIGATTTLVAGALTRVMAIPAVNRWLVNLGMGSVPKSTIEQ